MRQIFSDIILCVIFLAFLPLYIFMHLSLAQLAISQLFKTF